MDRSRVASVRGDAPHTVRIERDANLPRPLVVVADHRHDGDVERIAARIPPPIFFVARRELGGIPLLGFMLRRGGHPLMDRGSTLPGERVQREGGDRLREGGRVSVFPEGRRSRDGRVEPLRSGAFRLAARSDAWRQALRAEMQAVHDRLAPETGPRI